MPRSKRDKKITLTKVKKRGRDGRTELIDKVRAAVDEHEFLYVLKFDALRSVGFNDVRREWRESSLFLGKNKLMALALGRTPQDEVHDNARRVSARLVGDAALLATSRPREDVLGFFEKLATPQFACAGAIATKTVKLAAGTLPADKFPASKLPELRKLGVEAEVNNAALVMREPFLVCTKGKPLSAVAAKLLTHLDERMATFKVTVAAVWERESGAYESLVDDDEMDDDDDDDDDV